MTTAITSAVTRKAINPDPVNIPSKLNRVGMALILEVYAIIIPRRRSTFCFALSYLFGEQHEQLQGVDWLR